MDIRYIEAFTLDEMSQENGKALTHDRVNRCTPLRIKYYPKSKRYIFLVRCSEKWSSPKGHIVSMLFDSKKQLPKATTVDVRVFCSCLTGDTKIPLLDGRELTLEDIGKEFGQGKDFWVYSVDNKGDFKPGKAKWLGITKFVNRLVDITLDNGEVISCTEDHRFMLRDGSYVEAKDLKEDTSLMPLYFDEGYILGDTKKKSPYKRVKLNSSGKWKYVHRIVANEINTLGYDNIKINSTYKNFPVIHHSDFNRFNNSPDNLIWMLRLNHWTLHSNNYNRDNVINAYKKIWKDESRIPLLIENRRKAGKICIEKHPEILKKLHTKGREWINNNRAILSKRMKDRWKNNRSELLNSLESSFINEDKRKITSNNRLSYWKSDRSKELKVILTDRMKNWDQNGEKNVMKRAGFRVYVNVCRAISAAISIENELNNFNEQIWIENKSRFSIGEIHSIIGWDKFCEFISLAKKKSLTGNYSGFLAKDKTLLFDFCKNIETNNHKVSKIVIRDLAVSVPVYDLQVEGYENFLLSSGVIVHNCPAWQYWGSAYLSTTLDYNLPESHENRFPYIRDPGLINTTCKHVLTIRKKVLDNIRMKNLRERYQLEVLKNVEDIRKTESRLVMSFEEFAVRDTLKKLSGVNVSECKGAVENFLNRSGGFSDASRDSFVLDLTPNNFEDNLGSIGMLIGGR